MTIEGDGKEYELLTKWAKDFDCEVITVVR